MENGKTENEGQPEQPRENQSQLQAIRKCTYAGRKFGDNAFVEEMERRFQRKWLRGSKKSAELAKSA
jgi:hypothetical protein